MISVIGHRGAPRVQRENTIPALAAAFAAGADAVELDVRRTADGALVVHHDPALPDARLLANVELDDLPEWLPTLAAAVAACAGHRCVVEVKSSPLDPGHHPDESTARAAASLLAASSADLSSMAVSSFSLAAIDAARDSAPGLPTAWLTLPGYDQHAALDAVVQRGHRALHPHDHAITAAVVAAAHDAGIEVVAWTVDDPERMRVLADMGEDGIITNVPDLAVAVLAPWRPPGAAVDRPRR